MPHHLLRTAGPNEKRCIIRHQLGFYSNIAVAGVYVLPCALANKAHLHQQEFYALPLVDCFQQHSFLSATIQDADTNAPSYTRPHELDVRTRVRLRNLDDTWFETGKTNGKEDGLIQRFLEHIHNDATSRFTLVESEPAWALDVLPLISQEGLDFYRVLISFTYSHSHGDGVSGIIFHQTYHEALEKYLATEIKPEPLFSSLRSSPLPDQPDTPSKLPISLTYLLLPALGTYLPPFLTKPFGISGNVSGADSQTWTGSKTFIKLSDNHPKVQTDIEIVEIEAQTLNHVLALCSKNGIKLTALFNFVIAQAMHTALRRAPDFDLTHYTNFIATIPVNLRKVLGMPPNTIGNFGGAAYLRYDLENVTNPINQESWNQLRAQSQHLSRIASTARNQPIGLLRFVSNFANWMTGQIGQTRDCSWELSNLGDFNLQHEKSKPEDVPTIRIEKLFFSQPASPVGPPITYNVVGMNGGSLSVCMSWQPGALSARSVSVEKDDVEEQSERQCIHLIGATIKASLEQLGSMA